MPGGASGDSLAKYDDLVTFSGKNECSRNFKSRICKTNRRRYWRILQNNWRYCEFYTSSNTNIGRSYWKKRPCFEPWVLRLGLFTSASGILYFCAWLLLFEVLRELSELLSLSFVSCAICCTTLSVLHWIIVNYSWWKYLSVPEISAANKSSII